MFGITSQPDPTSEYHVDYQSHNSFGGHVETSEETPPLTAIIELIGQNCNSNESWKNKNNLQVHLFTNFLIIQYIYNSFFSIPVVMFVHYQYKNNICLGFVFVRFSSIFNKIQVMFHFFRSALFYAMNYVFNVAFAVSI